MEADSGLGFLHAITTKRSFGLVWGNDDDISTPEMTFEDSRECIVGYVPGSRRKRAAALKMWSDDHHDFATLYLPDDVWKFQRASSKRLVSMVAATSSVTGGDGGWVPREQHRGRRVADPEPVRRGADGGASEPAAAGPRADQRCAWA